MCPWVVYFLLGFSLYATHVTICLTLIIIYLD